MQNTIVLRLTFLGLFVWICNGLSLKTFLSSRTSRTAAATIGGAMISFVTQSAQAVDISLHGIVSIAPNVPVPTGEKVALYLTVREDVGIWQSAVRNQKPPPVLTKKITQLGDFPISFDITSQGDLTPEGAAYNTWLSGKQPLSVAVRLDTDGVAATRDPDDLVGQGSSELVDGKWTDVVVALEGRGVAGKFITNKK